MNNEDERPLPKGIIRSKPILSSPTEALEPSPTVLLAKKIGSGASVDRMQTRGIITAIEPQARQEGRVNIFVDGKFAIGLFLDVAATLGLKIGQTISPERLTELADAEMRRKAREDAYRLLSYRARTEHEITERLRRNGYEDDVIAETIRYLYDQHLLDDADFAARHSASRSRTHGGRAIAMQLRQKGIDAETIREVVAETVDVETQRESALSLATKRVGERPTDASPAAQARISSFLARRGFDWETIRTVLHKLYDTSTTEGLNDEG